MIWFAVWTVLVVGTLVGAALLGLSLWRKVKAVLAELKATEHVLDQLQQRIDELEAARPDAAPFQPAVLATDEDRDRWRSLRQANLRARAARRTLRRALGIRRALEQTEIG